MRTLAVVSEELIVTSTPIELKALLDDLIDKIRIFTDVLTPENINEMAVNMRAAALEAERASIIVMREEPDLDQGS